MAKMIRIGASVGGRLPSNVKVGSQAFLRKGATISARAGMKDVIKRYESFIRQFKGITPEILEEALQPAFDKSQEYVPKDSGALADSGKVTTSLDPLRAEITYGDSTAWYAAIVHEYVWQTHEPPTRAKYLQAAMEEEMDNMMVTIGLSYQRAMGG